MKLYNTATRKLETFVPADANNVKVYTCGPTVYDFQHIGNYAAQIYWDLLVRTLIANGYQVRRVLNLTDVGHLVSDGDEGEDKLEKGARRENKSVWDIANFYIEDFLTNFRKLNLIEPTKICRATDYIEADEALVNNLIAGGYTYETSDGIYFDTAKFPTYADFARLDLDNLKAGARVEFSSEKHNPSDFAVWKFIKEGENHAMRWDYLGRPGYPGWHLECSTIIHEELGETIDIHCGGIDHIPVHHTNEIAQSEAAFNKPMCRTWLHCDFIMADSQKISKSLGNVYLLKDIEARNFSPMDFKLWLLQGHYQSARNFTFDDLAAAKNRRLRYRNQIAMTYQLKNLNKISLDNILTHVNNNLNSPAALAELDKIQNADLAFWHQIDDLLGLNLVADSPDLNAAQKDLLAKRQQARQAKNYSLSDELRAELKSTGITVKDTADGQIWQYC